jgi:hypothetical protein
MKKVQVREIGKIASKFIENQCNAEIIGFIKINRLKETYADLYMTASKYRKNMIIL